jgi:virulence factor Mce-like protein
MIRGRAITTGCVFLLMLGAVVYWLLIPRAVEGSHTYQAEFADAGLLSTGDDVVEYGAKAGSVVGMRLTSRGTALVTFSLFSGVAPPRADASASVRPQNLLGGDSLSLSPGQSAQRLEHPIPASRTFVATQLNDLFNAVGAPRTAAALSLLLNELGLALDARGEDLNQAVLELAPTFDAADRVSTQLAQQNAHLRDLIVNAEAVTAQIAPRTADVDRLITGLRHTLQTTARGAVGLNRGLDELPATLSQTRHTLALLGSAATAATPLATQLTATAPELATAVTRLPAFVSDAAPAIEQLRPLVRQAYGTLEAGTSSLPRLSSSLHDIRGVIPPTQALAKVLSPLAQVAIQGLFGGLGGAADEPGTQPGDYDPGRNWFRGVAVLSCESFGVAIAPGCLTTVLKTLSVPPIGGITAPPVAAAHARRLAPEVTHTPDVSAPSPGTAPSSSSAGDPLPAGSPAAGILQSLLKYLVGR